ncbi:urease accessory protein UreD [Metallosphaera hakonensis]|uniref:Urease accessory protein UreH n=1 Tax=Metallosphaera hakonensis JCM 8857 = DSM 7519 TaxID=1293036 RepID=A0A2U9IR44_9CREN|nr:urease accessory protein UreD [Metallosphaera hakonensis]AWR98437.1 urease accessory protein UreH [Metallosphaera hakonensis JCM 8857 = DSM 7519]
MRNCLNVEDRGNRLVVVRTGTLNALLVRDMVILVNPSEVLVGEDRIEQEIQVKGKVVTDQAYTKVLSDSKVTITSRISLENSLFFPHPILVYNGGGLDMESYFHVTGKAKVVEAIVLGRIGSGERFQRGKIRVITKIWSGDELLIYDVFRVNDGDYLDPNVLGKEGLLTTYSIEGKEFIFDREILTIKELYRRWSQITGITF